MNEKIRHKKISHILTIGGNKVRQLHMRIKREWAVFINLAVRRETAKVRNVMEFSPKVERIVLPSSADQFLEQLQRNRIFYLVPK